MYPWARGRFCRAQPCTTHHHTITTWSNGGRNRDRVAVESEILSCLLRKSATDHKQYCHVGWLSTHMNWVTLCVFLCHASFLQYFGLTHVTGKWSLKMIVWHSQPVCHSGWAVSGYYGQRCCEYSCTSNWMHICMFLSRISKLRNKWNCWVTRLYLWLY